MRWTDRFLGFVSTLVLARLLLPEDFGLIAMAMVVAGLIDVLLDLGVGAALIQDRQADAETFNTAWTLRLGQAAVAAATLVGCAPFMADYYGDDRLVAIFGVIAITVLVGGLENIGTVSFQRNMEFGRDFQYFFLKRIVTVAFTISAAILLRSYWALVLGSLVSRLAGVCVSYWVSTFRPRLSLARFSRIWSFSQWNLVREVGLYLDGSVGRFVIGRRADASVLGAYAMGEEIASMPTTELLAPLGRVMFPAFSAAKHAPQELLRLVKLSLSVQALVAIPASIGVALVADDAVPLLLGETWRVSVPIAQVIALTGIAISLGHSSNFMLMALGRIRTLCIFTWSRALILIALLSVFVPGASAEGVALARLATAFVGLAVLQLLAHKAVPGLGGRAILSQIWRPLAAGAAMAVAVVAVSRSLAGAPPIARLAADIAVGALAYGSGVLLLWRAAGSPAGPETYILDNLRLRLRGGQAMP